MRTITEARAARGILARMSFALIIVGAIACTASKDGTDEEASSVQQAWTARRFGVYAQKDFYDKWLCSLDYQWTMTNDFVNNLDDTDTKMFYDGMWGDSYKRWYDDSCSWHDGQTGGLDTVDLFLTATHGWYTNSSEKWHTYPVNGTMYSYPCMRLGDDSRGLSIFAGYSCGSLQIDQYSNGRWGTAIAGGLRIVLGTPAPCAAGAGMYTIGNKFADYLQAGYSMWLAWYWALTYSYAQNPVAVMTSGASGSNCWWRMNNMTWQNFKNGAYPRLRDGAIAGLCYAGWNDDE